MSISRPAQPGGDQLTTHNQRLGAYGEMVAARHLSQRGFVLLDRNWRCEIGEIDLVLREGPVLVVCEVKTRRSHDFGAPLEAVDQRKVERLQRLAYRWLQAHRARVDDVRIDLVGVTVPRQGSAAVEHVEGVG